MKNSGCHLLKSLKVSCRSKGFPIFRRLGWWTLICPDTVSQGKQIHLTPSEILKPLRHSIKQAEPSLAKVETCPHKTCLVHVLQVVTSFGTMDDLFRAEIVTSIWGIKRSLWRSWVYNWWFYRYKHGYTVQTQLSSQITLLMWTCHMCGTRCFYDIKWAATEGSKRRVHFERRFLEWKASSLHLYIYIYLCRGTAQAKVHFCDPVLP